MHLLGRGWGDIMAQIAIFNDNKIKYLSKKDLCDKLQNIYFDKRKSIFKMISITKKYCSSPGISSFVKCSFQNKNNLLKM